jgi:hypothetical protein
MKRLIVFVACLAAAVAQAPALTNTDVIKLAKSGFSDGFILNLVETQGSRLASDVSSLIELKAGGVSESVLAAITKKNPSREKLSGASVVALAKAGFSESFLVDLVGRQPGAYSLDAPRIVELRTAGVTERVLSAMLAQGGGRELAGGAEISIRMIDAIDSETNSEGQEFRASLEDPITLGDEVIAPKGAGARIRLVQEKDSGKLRGKAELTVELVGVTIRGQNVDVSTTSVSEYSGSRGARTAKSAAAVGAIGAVIGAIAGGGKGAAIGAAAGAGAGAGAQVFMKGQRVRIPSETVLTFTTSAPVKLP